MYKEKFDNFNGYELIIVGAFDNKELPNILKKYFASLPSEEKIITPRSLKLNIPKNIVNEKIVKGVDKKATVSLIFPYNSTYGYKERVLYSGFSRVLNIALIEDIREKIGGVYSIYSKTSLSPNNFGAPISLLFLVTLSIKFIKLYNPLKLILSHCFALSNNIFRFACLNSPFLIRPT